MKVDVEVLRRMRAEGHTLQQIGDEFGVSRQAVGQWVKRLGLPRQCRNCGAEITSRAAYCFECRTTLKARSRRHDCRLCGRPVDGPKGRDYHPDCFRKHASLRVAATIRALNAETLTTAFRNNQRWTPEEDAAIVFPEAGETRYALARRLHRSYTSIQARRHTLTRRAQSGAAAD